MEKLPVGNTPDPTRDVYYIALNNKGTLIEGPWLHVEEFLKINPQQSQGGLYAAQTDFLIVKQSPDLTKTILYRWETGSARWVKVA